MQPADLDLAAFDTVTGAEAGFELELLDPRTQQGSGRFITLLGTDSDAYRTKMAEIQRRRSELMVKTRKFTVSPEEQQEDRLALLVCATAAWRGIKLKSGDALPFSAENVRQLYAAFPAIRDQVEEAIGDRANFLPRSASSS